VAWYQQQGVSPAIATEYDVIAHRKYRADSYIRRIGRSITPGEKAMPNSPGVSPYIRAITLLA
jgi:hypothetical protein